MILLLVLKNDDKHHSYPIATDTEGNLLYSELLNPEIDKINYLVDEYNGKHSLNNIILTGDISYNMVIQSIGLQKLIINKEIKRVIKIDNPNIHLGLFEKATFKPPWEAINYFTYPTNSLEDYQILAQRVYIEFLRILYSVVFNSVIEILNICGNNFNINDWETANPKLLESINTFVNGKLDLGIEVAMYRNRIGRLLKELSFNELQRIDYLTWIEEIVKFKLKFMRYDEITDEIILSICKLIFDMENTINGYKAHLKNYTKPLE